MAAKVPFRGGWSCSCTATWLPMVELVALTRGMLEESYDIMQLSWRTDVGASAGTHSAGGTFDLRQRSPEHIDLLRWAGGTQQERTRAQGFDPHSHGWPHGCPHLSPAAKQQARQWENGTNGLVSAGPIIGRYPVVSWQTGMERMRAELTKFADDIVTRSGKAAAKEVHAADVIPNTFTGNTKNPTVILATALAQIGTKVNALQADLDAQDKKLTAILAKLGA